MKTCTLMIMFIACALTGCGPTRMTISTDPKITGVCINNVTYITFDRGITIALDEHSKVVPCTNTEVK